MGLLLKESTRKQIQQQPLGEISRGLHCMGQTTACTNLQVSHVDMHDSGKAIFEKVPFAIGWRTHFNFCVANLPDPSQGEPILRKSKQFTIFEFIRKQENDEIMSDYDTP